MKRITLLAIVLTFMVNIALAQNSEVQNAYNNNRYAQQYIESAEKFKSQNRVEKSQKEMNNAKTMLQKAKTSIDNAVQHEKTINDPKAWHYYGIIYYNISSYPEFNDIEPNALEKSFEGFSKIAELDQSYFQDEYQSIASSIISISDRYAIMANENIENSNYVEAINNLRKTYEIKKSIGQNDNEALIFAAQYATIAKEYQSTIELCDILINNSYEAPQLYQYLAIAHRELGNDDLMLQYLQTGREKFSEDESLINEQINAYLKLQREAEIIDQIVEMATKQTDNPIYYFILGTIYSNAESSLYNLETALEYYNKAIEINPNSVDPYINIGSMYIDKSAELYKTANDLPIDKVKEYEDMIAEAKSYDEKALPFVEKAYELLPDDENVKRVLLTLYRRLKMNDKANALESAE